MEFRSFPTNKFFECKFCAKYPFFNFFLKQINSSIFSTFPKKTLTFPKIKRFPSPIQLKFQTSRFIKFLKNIMKKRFDGGAQKIAAHRFLQPFFKWRCSQTFSLQSILAFSIILTAAIKKQLGISLMTRPIHLMTIMITCSSRCGWKLWISHPEWRHLRYLSR